MTDCHCRECNSPEHSSHEAIADIIADHERIRAAWEAVRQAPGAPTRIQSHALFILLDEVFG